MDSNFQPHSMVERYESLIWTERYLPSGDFVLVTPRIQETLQLMPLESTVTIRESTVPMVVESHKIQKPTRGVPKLEVRGRSCETWLDRRVAMILALDDSYTEIPAQYLAAKSASDAAYKAIRAAIGDVERFQGLGSVLSAIAPVGSALDAFLRADTSPIVNLPLPADYVALTDDWTNYEIPRDNLYRVVLDLISQNHHGIKAVRPVTPGDTQIDIEIYNGADLTETVVFDARFDQFDDATYLFSKQGSVNIAYIFGPTASERIRKNDDGVTPEVAGLDRRVMMVDESSNEGLTSHDLRRSRALVELYNYNVTALFDGQTSDRIASGFNSDYFLGDILKLVGEFGLSENVRVAEFIRSEEPSGERSYPAFEVVE